MNKKIHEVLDFRNSRFLRTTRASSKNVDMIMNAVKYDTNKTWVIHNLSQQKLGNLQLFEKNSFEEKS
jgi:hypothetical protein